MTLAQGFALAALAWWALGVALAFREPPRPAERWIALLFGLAFGGAVPWADRELDLHPAFQRDWVLVAAFLVGPVLALGAILLAAAGV